MTEVYSCICSCAVTENGWTDDKQCLNWFTQSFIPQARARTSDDSETILLIMDGHGSHVTQEMRDAAIAHNIALYILPPHTTHMLQPLDVGVFGPLQNNWLFRCTELQELSPDDGLHRRDVVREYLQVREESVTERLVKAAWRKTGLEPLNPDVFTDADFAPSHNTSTNTHLPPSCPISHPSIPCTTSPDTSEAPDAPPDLEIMGVDDDQSDWDESEDEDEEDDYADINSEYEAYCDVLVFDVLADVDATGVEIDEILDIEVDQEDSGEVEDGEDDEDSDTEDVMEVEEPESDELTVDPSASPGGNLTSTDLPTTLPAYRPPFRSAVIPPRWPLARRFEALHDDYQLLFGSYHNERQARESAETHCALAAQEIRRLKNMLNAKNKKAKAPQRRLRCTENFLTGPKAAQVFEEQERVRKQKEADEAAKEARKQVKAKEAQVRRAELLRLGPQVRITGCLSKKDKSELLELAFVLGLATDDSKSRDIVYKEIKHHFEDNPALKTDPRFAQIFSRSRRSPRSEIPDADAENVAPPTSGPSNSFTVPTPNPQPPFPIPYGAGTFTYLQPIQSHAHGHVPSANILSIHGNGPSNTPPYYTTYRILDHLHNPANYPYNPSVRSS